MTDWTGYTEFSAREINVNQRGTGSMSISDSGAADAEGAELRREYQRLLWVV